MRIRSAAPALRIFAVWSVFTATGSLLTAQERRDVEEGPRFLLAIARGEEPAVPVEVSAVPLLRRRLTLRVADAPLPRALAEIGRAAGVVVAYSPEVLPAKLRVRVHAQELTLAAVLTDVLLDARVDVLITGRNRIILVPREGRAVPAADTGAVSGRVTDRATGWPIAGATVVIEGTRYTATTDSDGFYRIADVPVGTYRVHARYIGYAPSAASISVSAAAEVVASFVLQRSAQQLDEVVTTGTVIPTELRAVPTPVSVITADDIQVQQLRRVDQVFRSNVPGSFSWDRGADDIVNSVNVRGTNSLLLPASGVKTYVDGIEVANDAFTLVDVKSVERIEILRGPEASTIYGSGASGGVMQIFTKKGDLGSRRPQFEGGASVGAVESPYESSLDQEYSASVRGGTQSVSYSLGGSYQRTGEWVPEYHLAAPGGYGGVRLVQGPLTIGLSARYASRNVGQVFSPLLRAAGYEFFQSPKDAEATNRNQTYGVSAGYAATPSWQHNVSVGFDRFVFEYWNTRPRPIDSLFDQTINQQEEKVSLRYNTSASFSLSPALSTVLTAGAEYYRFNSSFSGAFGSRTNEGTIITDFPGLMVRGLGSNTGYFAQARLEIRDAVFVTAGVRAERNSAFGADFGTALAPRVGISWVQNFGFVTAKLRGSYGEALRPPAYGSNTDQPGLVSNPNLGPEEQVGGEAGVDLYFGAGAALSVTYYDQTARGLIDAVLIDATSDPLTYQYQNVGRIKNSGVEFEGRLRPGRLDLSANYSITNSTVRELGDLYTGDLQVGDQLLGIPKHSAGVQASYDLLHRTLLNVGITHLGSWTNPDYLALYGFFFGGQEYRGSNRAYWIRYPSLTKLNAGLQQSIGDHVSLLLAVDNLTNNQRFEEINLAVTPGRRTTVGVRLNY